MERLVPSSWWQVRVDQLFDALSATKDGLKAIEAEKRLKTFGPNVLAEQKKLTVLRRFFGKLANPLILLLFAAAGVSALLGQVSDFVIIATILLGSLSLDVFQEHAAEASAEKLRKRVSLTATILRDGVTKEIPFSHVVPGDVVTLTVGDIVPADCRLLAAKEFFVDQSTLTGESYPQAKTVTIRPGAGAGVSERTNAVFLGTTVVTGEAMALVVVTGRRTELGKISTALVAPRPPTAFEKGITQYGVFLMKIALAAAGFVLASHMLLSRQLLTTLEFVLALAIGFAPELLPIILTINLSKGAVRMSGKGVIVKHLPAIENFGSMEILATDKTGTLTENAITLAGHEDIRGSQSEKVLLFGRLSSIFQSGFKGPLEQAILAHEKPLAVHDYTYVATIPFDFFRKRVSVVVTHRQKRMIIVKGTPEELLRLVTRYADGETVTRLTEEKKLIVRRRFEALSRQGLRALTVAYKELPDRKTYTHADENDLVFLGFLTFTDPPKRSAIESLATLIRSGVEIKVLTGDNELVTETVCRELRLPIKAVVTGSAIDALSDDALAAQARQTTIFARLNPSQKERVLAALRSDGTVVGYLGDGINDAQSLRAADIGISVNNASDVAKASADIILLHKDLGVLHEGVVEGRKTFGNALKYIMMGTSSNFGNMMSVAIASLFLPFLPMLPVQILLNDLLYDVSQLLIAADNVDHSFTARPKKWDIRFISRFTEIFSPANSLFDLITFSVLLWFFRASVPLFQTGWFLENILAQTLIVFSIRTAIVPFFKSRPNRVFALSLLVISALAVLLPYTPFGGWFSFVRVPGQFYFVLAGIIVCYVVLVELLKRWFYRHFTVARTAK